MHFYHFKFLNIISSAQITLAYKKYWQLDADTIILIRGSLSIYFFHKFMFSFMKTIEVNRNSLQLNKSKTRFKTL